MGKSDLKIRLATCDDFDTLTDISRVCFPEQLRWKAPKSHSRKWWDNLINSQYCEIWVCSVHGQVIAFVALVFDRIKYEDAWENHHLSFLETLYIFVTCPKQSLKRTLIKLKLKRVKKLNNHFELFEESRRTNSYEKIKKIFTEKKPWCGPSAVLPDMRGEGVSKKIHEHCFERAISLGYKEVYSVVKRKNMMSRVMVAILGFEVFEKIDHVLFYKKTLENNCDPQINSA